MFDIVMTIACAIAITSTWLFYSNSKIADRIRFKMFMEYVNGLKNFV